MTVVYVLMPDVLRKRVFKTKSPTLPIHRRQLCFPSLVTLCISIGSRLMTMKAGDQLFLFHKELSHMLGCSYTANIELLCLVQIGNLIHSSLHSLRVQRIWSRPKISPSPAANRLRNKTKSHFFFFEVF